MNRLNVFEWLCELTSPDYVYRMFPNRGDVRRMVAVEFVLYAIYQNKMDGWFPLEDGEVLISGWHKLYTKDDSIRRVVERIGTLTRDYQLKNWKDWLFEYQQFPRNYRLFEVDPEGKKKLERVEYPPVSGSDRELYYRIMLEQKIPYRHFKLNMAECGKTYYYLRGNTAVPVTIPSRLNSFEPIVDHFQRTKKTALKIRDDFDAIGREMDECLRNKGEDPEYEDRLKKIELVTLSPNQSLSYPDLLHILGGLGAGKSTFITAQAYALCTYDRAKAGIIETRVDDVVNKARELRNLGLRVVTFVGKSERVEYEKRIMSKSSIEQLNNDQRLEDVSSFCIVHALADDQTPSDWYPCTSLYQYENQKKKTRFMCPLWKQCGLYYHYNDIEQADVLIATPASLVHMIAPVQLFPQKSVFELFYEITDIVFVDEADQVQYNLDQSFMMDLPLIGDPSTFVENILQGVIRQTSGTYKDIVNAYREATANMDQAARAIYQIVESNRKLRNQLKRQIVFKRTLLYGLNKEIESWAIPDKFKRGIKSLLKRWSSYPDPNHVAWDHDEKTVRKISRFMQGKSNLEDLLDTDLTGPKDEKTDLDAKWRFVFWLCSYEYWLSFLEKSEDEVRQEIEDFSANFPFRMKENILVSYLPRAMTGVQYGYQLVTRSENGNPTHVIKMFAYYAVGRELLYQWTSFFEHAGLDSGPSIVLLSGTTLSPVSTPLSLAVGANWLLKSPNQSYHLEQMIWDKTRIRISGQNKKLRTDNLRILTQSIIDEIHNELKRWQKGGTKRGVLCIVNSYDDCIPVMETLRPKMNGLGICSLAKETSNFGYITRHELIQQASSIDVLVAPIGAMNRGLNLVDQEGKALFGTVFFLARPYPSPENVEFMLTALHSLMEDTLGRIQRNIQTSPLNKLRKLRRIAHAIFQEMYATPDYWSGLPDKKRKLLAWILFVNIWQMIGRLVRGGQPARVYYCDASFYERIKNEPTLLEEWQQLLNMSDCEVYGDLYGPFIDSLNQLLFHQLVEEEEEEYV